jgi:Amidohydrolase family
VQSGAEDTIPTLIAKQEELDAKRRTEMAERFVKRPKAGLLVSNARVFDPRDLSLTPNTSILVMGNRIVEVGPDGSIVAPAEVTRIDGGGRFLMPGLWDNHTHGDDVDGLLTLAAGITSVRDMANDETKLPDRKRRIDAGKEVGPRILLAGFMDGAGPFAGPTRARVSNEAEALKWIQWYADNGYEQIKVYSSLDIKLLPMIVRETHARGMRLSGHVPAFMTAEQFIEAGADELQHLNFVFLNFLFDKAPDTRDMTRFTAVGKNASDIKPENARERRFIELLAKNRIVLDPTINVFEDMFNGASDKVSPGYETVVARLPPTIARSMKGGNLPFATADAARVAGAMQSMKHFLRALHGAGVTLLPGSDSLGGFGFLRELELWDEAGIARAEILRAATLTSAQVNRRAHELGVIAPTMLADFVLIDGDPIARMADVRRASLVVKDGVAYSVADLQRAISVQPLP